MPAMTCALSAICGTHLGETKLVTSISLSPASCRRCTRPILTSAGTGSFSFCRPSRGPTSTSLTLWGRFIMPPAEPPQRRHAPPQGAANECERGGSYTSVSSLWVNHAGDGLSPLQGEDLPRYLRNAFLAQGAGRSV